MREEERETISAEELAGLRHRAVRQRLNGPQGWFEALLFPLHEDIRHALADPNLNGPARESIEEHKRTLDARLPNLIRLLDEFPPARKQLAFSAIYYLIWLVRDRGDEAFGTFLQQWVNDRGTAAVETHRRQTLPKHGREAKSINDAGRKKLELDFLKQELIDNRIVGDLIKIRPSKHAAALLAEGSDLNKKATALGLKTFSLSTLTRRLAALLKQSHEISN